MTTFPAEQLDWRCIGPYRGGRVVAVAGDPADPHLFYFGATGGGVWRSDDAGQYWENISDGYFRRASVGAICVSSADRNVLYAGMGETTIRGNVSHGDGVYKSTNGGKTWTHLGLAATRSIARIATHPHDPDTVYVAAFGHAHGPNPERGLYTSRDGGKSWSRALFRSNNAGAIDLSMDASNPRVLYVSFWEGRRGPSYMSSGGPGSGIFRSEDGGRTFDEINGQQGLPEGNLGKIGIAASPARAGRVWAIIEHEESGGVFRSDDYGETWTHVNSDGDLRQRAWYYSHIVADPVDADTVWVLNLNAWRSIDGGVTFQPVSTPHTDHHDLWISPSDPSRLIMGSDGGACVSLNGGQSWSSLLNQPTSEMYHVTLDSRNPYRVYGGQQDNTTISVPSWSAGGFIPYSECYTVGGGESAHIAVRPDNPDIVFAGDQQGRMTRYDHGRGQLRDVSVWPEHFWGMDPGDRRFRFNWTFPIYLSPHDPNVLYAGANVLLRSIDEGLTWETISDDLTRNDHSYHQPPGPVGENANGEVYGTIYSIVESPLERGVIWVGSDDGRLHVSRTNGANWQDVTPADLPEWARVSCVEPGAHDPKVAYLAADRHMLNDFQPLILRTGDYGATWESIVDGIPHDDFVRVIREDPECPGLLYAGTETGVYVSFDSGHHWRRASGSLPVVPVHDLAIRDNDLVAATHGRSFWISGDLHVLRDLAQATLTDAPRLFTPPVTIRRWGADQSRRNGYLSAGGSTSLKRADRLLDSGSNGPSGVIVHYILPASPITQLQIAFHDAAGREIRAFCHDPALPGDGSDQVLPANPGMNRLMWDLRHPDPPAITSFGGDRMNASGPRVPPGDYEVRLSYDGLELRAPVRIKGDPRSTSSHEDIVAQYRLHCEINAILGEVNNAVNRIRALRGQVLYWLDRAEGNGGTSPLGDAGHRLLGQLHDIEGQLIQTRANNMEDTLRLEAKLNAKLVWLSWTISTGDAAPTRQAYELFDELRQQAAVQLDRFERALATEVASFNNDIRKTTAPLITP